MSFELALFFMGKSTLLQFELSLFTEKTGISPDSCVSLNWHVTFEVRFVFDRCSVGIEAWRQEDAKKNRASKPGFTCIHMLYVNS